MSWTLTFWLKLTETFDNFQKKLSEGKQYTSDWPLNFFFDSYLAMLWPWTLTWGCHISEILNYISRNIIISKFIISFMSYVKWGSGSKTALLPPLGHVVTFSFGFQTSYVLKYWALSWQVFGMTIHHTLPMLIDLWLKKLYFCLKFGDVVILTCDLKFPEILGTLLNSTDKVPHIQIQQQTLEVFPDQIAQSLDWFPWSKILMHRLNPKLFISQWFMSV